MGGWRRPRTPLAWIETFTSPGRSASRLLQTAAAPRDLQHVKLADI